MRPLLLLLVACSGAKSPPAPPPTPAAPAIDAAPKPAGATFGRYTVVPPAGYEVDARAIEIGFRRDNILIVALDGAEFKMPTAEQCQGQLVAFTTGIVTGLARAETMVNVVSFKASANGCQLTGTTSATPVAYVEAAIVDHGIPGPAIVFLIHPRPDDGASTVFDQVVASIAPAKK